MRKYIVFAMLLCLMPQAWGERMRGTGVREPAMAGLHEAGNELFVIRVNSDGELIVDISGGSGGAGATEVTLAALLAKVIAAPSTEAKQDDLNALIVIIDAVLDTIKADTANISADQATETTAAAILAKLIAAPATESKQDDLNALIAIIDAVLDAIKLDTANISSDQATETTVALILAKLIAAPATEAKQDTGNSSLATIAGLDFATQTTLAALLAKTLVAPATEAKQDTGNTSLATIAGIDFATQTTLAALLAKIIAAPATEAKQDTGNTSLGNIDSNTDTGATIDHKRVVVGTSATLVSAADSGRRSITIQNDHTSVAAVGNSDVTLSSADATDGFILANGTPAGSGKGGSLTLETTSAVYVIGANASSAVIVITEGD